MPRLEDDKMLDVMKHAMRYERAMKGYIPFKDRELPYREFTLNYPEIQKLDKTYGLSGAAFMILWRHAWYSITTPKYKRAFCVLVALVLLIIGGSH